MIKGCEELYAQANNFFEQAKKYYEKHEKHANKTWKHVEFEVGQHVWLNIQDFKMPDGMAPCFTTTCAGLYEILHKLHLNVYILKLPTNFVAHPTFHVLTLKLFLMMNKNKNGRKGCN